MLSTCRIFAAAAAACLLATPLVAQPADDSSPAKNAPRQSRTVPPPPVVQDYEPRPAMWRLADEDTTIYLFGTFHLLPEGFRWRTAAFDRAVADAQELVVETSDAEAEAQFAGFEADMVALVAARGATSERLAAANRDKWRALARVAKIPAEAFDRMPIIMAMLSAGLAQVVQAGSAYEHGVETELEAQFATAGKPVRSIENAADVMRKLLAIDEAPLIAQLDIDLAAWDGVDVATLLGPEAGDAEDPLASEHGWAQGRQEPVFTEEDLADPATRAIHDVMLVDRNAAWAEWLEQRLERPGTVLLAVGAGHFEGDDSVLAKLSERGLTASRIQ